VKISGLITLYRLMEIKSPLLGQLFA